MCSELVSYNLLLLCVSVCVSVCLCACVYRYLSFHKEEMEVVDCFPGMVLEELQTYSSAVSRFFNVEQTYSLVQ